MKRVILQNTVLRMGMTLCLIITLNGCFWPFTMTNGQLVRRQESDFSKNPAEATVAPPKETQAMEPERIEEESLLFWKKLTRQCRFLHLWRLFLKQSNRPHLK